MHARAVNESITGGINARHDVMLASREYHFFDNARARSLTRRIHDGHRQLVDMDSYVRNKSIATYMSACMHLRTSFGLANSNPRPWPTHRLKNKLRWK
jgi:hypothetical protein